MSNVTTSQLLQDGPRNTVIKLTGQLDTSDQAYTIVLNPNNGSLSSPNSQIYIPQVKLRVKRIQYSIEDGLTVNLWWDGNGSSGTYMNQLEGRGLFDYEKVGDAWNNASPKTWAIALSTQGWTASAVLSYDILMEVVKYY